MKNWTNSKTSYGFEVISTTGRYWRWFNSNTNKTPGLKGKIANMEITQRMLDYHAAFDYSQVAAKEYGYIFRVLTENDWNSKVHPIKRFIQNLFKS